MRKLCITIDLEPDFAGLTSTDDYEACRLERLNGFFRIISKRRIKLTVFVVAKMLEKNLPIVNKLKDLGAEFELHSYSHNRHAPNTQSEIRQGKQAFFKYFGYYPKGYRTPFGKIKKSDFSLLVKEGFRYDSSIFPSFWPAPTYLSYSRHPSINLGLREYPLASLPIRIIVSQSWLKLLGWNFWKWALRLMPLPEIFVFDSHLHDFVTPASSLTKLNLLTRWVFKRNRKNSLKLFEKFTQVMLAKGYEFAYLSEMDRHFSKMAIPQ